MSNTNRHREPSTRQLLSRVYRRQLSISERIVDLESLRRLDYESGRETIRRLIDHGMWLAIELRRVVREKETMVRLFGWDEIQHRFDEANAYLAKPLPHYVSDLPVPVLRDAIEKIAAPAPPAHVYENMAAKRCKRCDCLRIAIEAQNLECV